MPNQRKQSKRRVTGWVENELRAEFTRVAKRHNRTATELLELVLRRAVELDASGSLDKELDRLNGKGTPHKGR